MSDSPQQPQPPGAPPGPPPGPPSGAGWAANPPANPQYPPPAYGQQPYYPQVSEGNGIAVAGGVLGIVAVATSFIPFVDFLSVVVGALAVIFGFIGNGRANRLGGAGKGMAITGIVCGIIAIAISLLFIAVVYSIVYHVSTNGGVHFSFRPIPT
jgi:hypothetical protein